MVLSNISGKIGFLTKAEALSHLLSKHSIRDSCLDLHLEWSFWNVVRMAVIGGCGVMFSMHRSAVGPGASGIETMLKPCSWNHWNQIESSGWISPLSSNNRASLRIELIFMIFSPAVIVACMQLSETTDPLTGETDFLHLSLSLVDGDARVASGCQSHRSNRKC